MGLKEELLSLTRFEHSMDCSMEPVSDGRWIEFDDLIPLVEKYESHSIYITMNADGSVKAVFPPETTMQTIVETLRPVISHICGAAEKLNVMEHGNKEKSEPCKVVPGYCETHLGNEDECPKPTNKRLAREILKASSMTGNILSFRDRVLRDGMLAIVEAIDAASERKK